MRALECEQCHAIKPVSAFVPRPDALVVFAECDLCRRRNAALARRRARAIEKRRFDAARHEKMVWNREDEHYKVPGGRGASPSSRLDAFASSA